MSPDADSAPSDSCFVLSCGSLPDKHLCCAGHRDRQRVVRAVPARHGFSADDRQHCQRRVPQYAPRTDCLLRCVRTGSLLTLGFLSANSLLGRSVQRRNRTGLLWYVNPQPRGVCVHQRTQRLLIDAWCEPNRLPGGDVHRHDHWRRVQLHPYDSSRFGGLGPARACKRQLTFGGASPRDPQPATTALTAPVLARRWLRPAPRAPATPTRARPARRRSRSACATPA